VPKALIPRCRMNDCYLEAVIKISSTKVSQVLFADF
jgi:hypothetical protein